MGENKIAYNVAIVEDNKNDCKTLIQSLKRYEQEKALNFHISTYVTASNFLDDYKPVFDVVFMDIELPDFDGMSTSKKLRQFDKNIEIIFVTNMAQFATAGYEVNAFDFIVKPISYINLKSKLDRLINKISLKVDTIIPVKTSDGLVSIPVMQLLYIEVIKHKLIFHTTFGDFSTTGSLYKYEQELKPIQFSRCNSCYLVNLRYVKSINKLETVVGNQRLKISYAKRKDFREDVASYLSRNI